MKRKALSLILALILTISVSLPLTATAEASAPYPSSLYLIQQTDVSCTLCSATMMLRARAYLSNNSGWHRITESNVRETAWVGGGGGLRWNFRYYLDTNHMTVSYSGTSGMRLSSLQKLLETHPEGIVLYCGKVPHAQYVTDVDSGVVYSSDPSCAYFSGRRPLASTRLGQIYGSQENVLANVTAFWYISSFSIGADASYRNGGGTSMPVASAQPGGGRTVSSGRYRIVSALDGSKCLNVAGGGTGSGTNVHLWTVADKASQKWDVAYLNNGYYSLKAAHSGKALDVWTGSNVAGTNVQQMDWDASNGQQWVLKDAGDGYFYIINKNGLYLAASDGASANGTNVLGWVGNGASAQKWRFEAADGTQTIEDGTYRLASALDLRKGLDVMDASTGEAANVRLWSYRGSSNQQFDITYCGDGFYSLVARHSGKRLDLHYRSVSPGANVEQYSADGTDTQRWILRDAGDGYYYLINSIGLYLDVSNGKAANGTNIQGWTGNGTKAQLWRLVPVGAK